MNTLSDYREIWLADFEFHQPDGELPVPLCLVAREFRTRRTFRVWADALAALPDPPFAVGPDALLVAYSACSAR